MQVFSCKNKPGRHDVQLLGELSQLKQVQLQLRQL